MSIVANLLKSILGEDSNTSTQAVGVPNSNNLVPDPNDFKTPNQLQIPDQKDFADRIGNIIDSIDENDITDDLADIVESYLEKIDPTGDMPVSDCAMMLPLADCQSLYAQLKSYLDGNQIDYSEDDQDDMEDMGMPNQFPADIYPSSATTIMGPKSVAPGGQFNLGGIA